ncbi:hypothetical protein A6R68_14061 [Neotoma lepida]|uniref:Transmembrane protein 183A n=1 Tax=Neotoma lepida TaxID=56216 RepID=A0A1A6HA22_NEOLE|nr:hypothetical protein A6R68_14061 [Neotoma lepida]
MARSPGQLSRPHLDIVAMPKRGKRLKFRAHDACSGRVTVADYANSDPAVVRSGRVKKAVANAVQQEAFFSIASLFHDTLAKYFLDGTRCIQFFPCFLLVKSLCGLEASRVPAEEALSGVGEPCDIMDSSDEMDAQEESTQERSVSRKKKSKRHKGQVLFEQLKSHVSCFRHYTLDASLPLRLRPESMEKLRCLRACVIRSLYHMYEPFAARISKNPAIPESTPSTLKNSKSPRLKSKCMERLQPPIQYEDVHTNPDQDCCLLQVTTLNFIFIPIVMGMIFTLFTINVSTDMRHHRVRLVFQDSPVRAGQNLRSEQGVQVVLDPVHSVRLFDWWHPQYPFSLRA